MSETALYETQEIQRIVIRQNTDLILSLPEYPNIDISNPSYLDSRIYYNLLKSNNVVKILFKSLFPVTIDKDGRCKFELNIEEEKETLYNLYSFIGEITESDISVPLKQHDTLEAYIGRSTDLEIFYERF